MESAESEFGARLQSVIDTILAGEMDVAEFGTGPEGGLRFWLLRDPGAQEGYRMEAVRPEFDRMSEDACGFTPSTDRPSDHPDHVPFHYRMVSKIDFDLVITAEDVGSYKPAPAHFERAFAELDKLGVPKEKILHTAQSLFHDHVPAKNHFGMTSIWINRRLGKPGGATKKPPEEVTPDWQVPTMAAMVELHKEHAGG